MKRILASLGVLFALAGGPAVAAGADASVAPVEAASPAVEEGRYCTRARCAPRGGSPSVAISFGIAVVASAWLGRRRRPSAPGPTPG